MLTAYPRSPEIKLGRAILLSDNGLWEQAIEDLELIAKFDPKSKLIEQLLKQAKEKTVSQQQSDLKQERSQR
jgi:hypothetical protein